MTVRIQTEVPTGKALTLEDLANKFNTLVGGLRWILTSINPEIGKMEPPNEYRRDGQLAYADGINWNPGAGGKGLYRYNGATSAWVKIG